MPATNRVEKHRGMTLVVQDDWVTIVRDATGYQVAGPAENDDAVRRLAKVAIPFLQGLVLPERT